MEDEPILLRSRAARHAALGDPVRLRIVDILTIGDASPSELGTVLSMPSNLLAHHLRSLEHVGLVQRTRSEGDRRRSYLRLVPSALETLRCAPVRVAPRVVFVCTANSARSHLAASLWRQSSTVPAASAGTHPAAAIAPGAIAVADRHGLPLPRVRPQHIADVCNESDFIVTVCDRAHEELDISAHAHWSVPDPVLHGSPEAFENAMEEIDHRVHHLAPLLTPG
ncbi:helix-turn-helix domain-containing protein [Georgenia sp. 10Sc9-8]|uniref:Helix-turn-helix domain-containing protein n=1 Tax=Georgenia halotolerans TaxID=3028317 RepID=A0ABT5TVI2_9MICO|nr:helix-turn-helix domain-containing protein [Georgenia halotolerans]